MESEDEQIQELIDELEELDSLLSPEAQELIRDLRPYIVTDDVYEDIDEQASFGDRVADKMSTFAGSWTFIIMFGVIMVVWISANAYLGTRAFDPFPVHSAQPHAQYPGGAASACYFDGAEPPGD